MVLRRDFQDILSVFIYTNLPVLMNPGNALRVVVSSSALPSTEPNPVLIIPPNVLEALQAASLDNFTSLGLPPDIGQIAKNFFANLPPLVNGDTSTTTVITEVPETNA